jgi:hypothetical protein
VYFGKPHPLSEIRPFLFCAILTISTASCISVNLTRSPRFGLSYFAPFSLFLLHRVFRETSPTLRDSAFPTLRHSHYLYCIVYLGNLTHSPRFGLSYFALFSLFLLHRVFRETSPTLRDSAFPILRHCHFFYCIVYFGKPRPLSVIRHQASRGQTTVFQSNLLFSLLCVRQRSSKRAWQQYPIEK